MTQNKKLFIGVLGHQNSGKSWTWNGLFGRVVGSSRTRLRSLMLECDHPSEKRRLTLENLFLVYGSPEERNTKLEKIIGDTDPDIVLCSMQYLEDAKDSLYWANENGFEIIVLWLNPGYDTTSYKDELGFEGITNQLNGTFEKINGKHESDERAAHVAKAICNAMK